MARIEQIFNQIDGDKFQQLYDYYVVIARKFAPEIANDEEWRRHVFFHQVLSIFGKKIKSWQDVEDKLFSKASECQTVKDFKKWLVTCFVNGLKSERKLSYFKKRMLTDSTFRSMEEDNYELDIPDITSIPISDPGIKNAALEIFSGLRREIRLILSFSYTESYNPREISDCLSLSKKTVYNLKSKAEKIVNEKSEELLGSLDEKQKQLVFALVILKCHEWSKADHE